LKQYDSLAQDVLKGRRICRFCNPCGTHCACAAALTEGKPLRGAGRSLSRREPAGAKAILIHESGGKPLAVGRNKNGTVDIGLAQYNSSNLPELYKYGIRPEHLFDECVASFVAAWHYAKRINEYGNTWFAIGAYHSKSPVENKNTRLQSTNNS